MQLNVTLANIFRSTLIFEDKHEVALRFEQHKALHSGRLMPYFVLSVIVLFSLSLSLSVSLFVSLSLCLRVSMTTPKENVFQSQTS
jgi:hypothetical protein